MQTGPEAEMSTRVSPVELPCLLCLRERREERGPATAITVSRRRTDKNWLAPHPRSSRGSPGRGRPIPPFPLSLRTSMRWG